MESVLFYLFIFFFAQALEKGIGALKMRTPFEQRQPVNSSIRRSSDPSRYALSQIPLHGRERSGAGPLTGLRLARSPLASGGA